MIRRFYVMPLDANATAAEIDGLLSALDDADAFIHGLLDSTAGLDASGSAVVWEMRFVDEETYTGPYMSHPYHMATLDNHLIPDSPECLTHDIATVRYELAGSGPRLREGIRRLLLMELQEGADTSALEERAARGEGMATSVFSPDDVAWRFPGKGSSWTHVWEQGFTDPDALERYLATPEGIASSSLEGMRRMGVDARSLRVLRYPFRIKPPQSPPEIGSQTLPILYTVTARTSIEDADAYVSLLRSHYDPPLAAAGATLLHRWRTVEHGYRDAEILSTWRLDSVAAFSPLRVVIVNDPSLSRFVLDGMPLVKSGTRRFYRALPG